MGNCVQKGRVLAERKLLLENRRDKRRQEVVFRIGHPYWIEKGVEAACRVEAQGLHDDLQPIHGVDFLQAIELSTSFLGLLLEGLADNYRVYWLDGTPYEADSGKRSLKVRNQGGIKRGRRKPDASATANPRTSRVGN